MRGLGFFLCLLLGCRGEPPAPAALKSASLTRPTLDLGAGGAPVIRLLDRLGEATLELSPSNLPAGAGDPGTFSLHDGWELAPAKAARPIWTRSSPVRLSQKRYTAAPTGMTLSAGSRSLTYSSGLQRGMGKGDWEVVDGALFVADAKDPGTWSPPPVLHHGPTARQEARFNLSSSGLTPAAYARNAITLGNVTRDAMLVPAPGKVSFSVAIPAGAHLRFGWGMAPPPALGHEAKADFAVSIDGTEIWSGSARADQEWQDAELDLQRWAGRTVSLVLSTDPSGSKDWDYPVFATPEIVGPPTADGPRRVVVIGIDTLRADHLGIYGYTRPTSPGIDALAAQSYVFDRAYAPAPRTRASFRTATTGRWPLSAIDAPTLGELLAAQGFSTAGVVANVHLSPRMGFAHGYGFWQYENSALAETQVDRALHWLGAHATEDSLLFLHLMDPHVFYKAPEPYLDLFTAGLTPGGLPEKYNRWMVLRAARQGKLSDENKAFMVGRYDGEIAYTDRELLRLVAALDEMPGKTLLVLHTDHGEEFWEHDSYEHNHTLYDELVHAVLIVRPPGGWAGGAHRISNPVGLVDIVPTLLDAIGVPNEQRPPADGLSLVPLLDPRREPEAAPLAQTLDQRPLQLGHLMYDTERWGVVQGSGKYILQTISGEEALYDLAADPGELHNLAGERADALPAWRAALETATGWPVGLGWRLEMNSLKSPVILRFDEPVTDAAVLDPEAARTRRANLEWGEKPPVLAEDVATVTLLPDGQSVQIVPGTAPRGMVAMLGPSPAATVLATVDGEDRDLLKGIRPLAGGRVRLYPSAVILPKDSEGAHLDSRAGEHDDDAAIEALQELGYIEDAAD